jgi:hypothetical protein
MNLVGAMSANEIRALEDMNSYEGGDEYFVQANMQSVKVALGQTAPAHTTNNTTENDDTNEEE